MSIRDKILRNNDNKDADSMDLLMRTIKAVHSATVNGSSLTAEDLKKQRTEMDFFSKLIAPSVIVNVKSFDVKGIPCEWISPMAPHRRDKVILYCHGGGYTAGGLGYARILADKLTIHTGLETISFEYRLAPEHPYPAAIEDGISVWDHLMYLGYGAKDVIIAGDSAGGNLALEIALELRKSGRQQPFALVLFSPWTDMRAVASSYKSCADKDPTITYEYVTTVRGAYLGTDTDYEKVEYSPVLADFTDFPPTLVQVGSNEILKGDSEHLAKNILKAGSYAKLEVYKGGWHVFQQMPLPKATGAMDNVAGFLANIIR